MNRSFCIALCVLSFANLAIAQDATTAPATAPTSAPTTEPAKVEATPPGFERITVGKYSAFCQSVDEAWIKQALTNIKPDKQPTTRPSDIIANVGQQRGAFVKDLAGETGVDPAKVSQMLDNDLLPTLKKISALQPPIVFMVATDDMMTSLFDNGWTNPRLHYNRLTKHIDVNDRIQYTIDRPMDETLWFVIYAPADSPADRAKKLVETVQKFDSQVAFEEATHARVVTRQAIANFINKDVFAPMKLSNDQSWFTMGVGFWLTARYSARLTGEQAPQALSDMIYEPPNAFIKANSIDLLSLPDLSEIRPEFQYSYVAAIRRKSTLAIQLLATAGDEAAIRKSIDAVKKSAPKDGPALLATIKAATSVDLTSAVHPGK